MSKPLYTDAVQVATAASTSIPSGSVGLWSPSSGGHTGLPLWRNSDGSDTILGTAGGTFLPLAGGTMAGDIAMAGHNLTTTDLGGQIGTFLARWLNVNSKQLTATWNAVDTLDTKRGQAALGFSLNNRLSTGVSGSDEYSPNVYFNSQLLSAANQAWALQAVANGGGGSAFALDFFTGSYTTPTRSYYFDNSGVITTPLGTVALLSDITGGTLQQSYTTGGAGGGTLIVTSSGGGLIIKDAATPISGPLLSVQSNDGVNVFFSVTADAPGTGALTFGDGASAPLSSTAFGNLAYDNTLHVFKVSTNGGAYVALGTVTTVTASSPLASSGGAAPDISLSGIVSAVHGGTGFASFTVGDILYADTTTTLAKKAAGTSHQLLHGAAGAPTWGAVDLASADVTGLLPDANLASTFLKVAVTSLTAGGGVTVSGSTGAVTLGTDNTVVALLAGSQTFTGAKTFGLGALASGSTAFDLSGSSGAQKSQTGANTFGGSSNAFTNAITIAPTTNQIVLGAAAHLITISSTAPAGAAWTITLPDPTAADTFVLRSLAQTLLNKTIDGGSNTLSNIANGSLSNSSLTVTAGTGLTGGGSVALGASVSLAVGYGTTSTTSTVGNDSRLPPAPSTQGRVLYDSGSAWVALAVGTDGQVLTTHGASANPTWTTVSGGGGGSGTVTSIVIGTGLASTQSPLTTTGTMSVDQSFSPTWTGTHTFNTNSIVLGANVGITSTAGSGPLTLGSMTGASTLPTGNLSWTAAAAKTATWSGPSTISPPAAATMATPTLTLTPGAHTANTASTEFSNVVYTAVTSTFATGALTTQRERLYNASTYAFAGASTITDAYAEYAKGPLAGTNATITNAHVYGAEILSVGTATTKVGFTALNTTAAANAAQQFSPLSDWQGQGWDSTASASKLVKHAVGVRPIQTAGSPTSELVYWTSSNAAAYSEYLKFAPGVAGSGLTIENTAGAFTLKTNIASGSSRAAIIFNDTAGTGTLTDKIASFQAGGVEKAVVYASGAFFVGTTGFDNTASGGGPNFYAAGVSKLLLTTTYLSPAADLGLTLGAATTFRWSTVYGVAYNSGASANTFDTSVAAGSSRKGFQFSDASTATTIATTDLIVAFRAGTANKLTLNGAGVLHAKRVSYDIGTSLVAGDFALSAGWGSTASIGSLAGSDANWYGTVTTAGITLAANPTIVLTFKDLTYTTAPNCIVEMSTTSDATNTNTKVSWTVTATALTITFNGTPIVTNTYVFNAHVFGVV